MTPAFFAGDVTVFSGRAPQCVGSTSLKTDEPNLSSALLRSSQSVFNTPSGRHVLLYAGRATFHNPASARTVLKSMDIPDPIPHTAGAITG